MHQRLRLLAALLLAAEREGPGRDQVLDRLRVDLVQRTIALGARTQTVGDDIPGRLLIVADILPGHWVRARCSAACAWASGGSFSPVFALDLRFALGSPVRGCSAFLSERPGFRLRGCRGHGENQHDRARRG